MASNEAHDYIWMRLIVLEKNLAQIQTNAGDPVWTDATNKKWNISSLWVLDNFIVTNMSLTAIYE